MSPVDAGMTTRDRRRSRTSFSFLFLAAGISLLPQLAPAQETVDFYRQNCKTCHTIGGGKLTGPDLKDVTKRRDRAWLIRFMKDPKAVIASGDQDAKTMLDDFNKAVMPTLPGMTDERCENLLKLIEAESENPDSEFKGVAVSTRVFTDKDRTNGRNIFLGRQRLVKGGQACISCHTMHDMPALGGGALGGDLTRIYEKPPGTRASISAWLGSPKTPTMRPVFDKHKLTDEEIEALVAYFEASADQVQAQPAAGRMALLLFGLVGAAALVFAGDAIWKHRFHGVRRPLVDSSSSRGR